MKVTLEEIYKIARSKLKSWLDKRTFRAHKLREVLVGTIFTIGLCEVACYKMLQSTVKSGDLPEYVPDMTIVVMALLETMASPLLAWLGHRRRRLMMLFFMPFITASTVSWILLPEVVQSEESEFCYGSRTVAHSGMVQSTIVRLSIVLCSCALFLLARAAVWCHGVAYLEEHGAGRVLVHVGVLLFVRVITYALGYHMIGLVLKTNQIIGYVVSFVIQTMQIIYFMPSKTLKDAGRQEILANGRSYHVSIARVLSRPVVLSQYICMGLLAAALWGYFYNSTDIIKVKFLIDESSDATLLLTEAFTYYGSLLAVLYIGLKWSHPIQTEFDKLRALKQSFTMTLLAGLVFAALALAVGCERGRVEGLDGAAYASPNCSSHCGCVARWREFSPVCVVGDMTTYLSPCQAGCRGVENIAGLMVYTECSCAGGGRAAAGACGARGCGGPHALQRALHALLLTFGVLALQAQLALMLRLADGRDAAVALGLAGACVALAAFVVGHVAYSWINATTCIWFDSRQCHLHSSSLPVRVGGSSAVLSLAAAVISLVTFVWVKIKERRRVEATRM